MLVMAAKLHHEYYWLSIAPVMAVSVGKGWVALARSNEVPGRMRSRTWMALAPPVRQGSLGLILASAFLGCCAVCSASTWRTPAEWRSLPDAAKQVQEHVPRAALVVAPEALLFAADRRGCRIEYTHSSARRAAGEWGESSAKDVDGPIALVEFYRLRGVEFFADVVPSDPDPRRLALHESVRRRYNVVVDLPGVLIASLKVSNEVVAHGQAVSGQ
jgi:hypothetical protein